MIELLSCPFCGEIPHINHRGGSCLEIECCWICVSIQISDLMTIEERLAEPERCEENQFYHQPEYIERARSEAIKEWNTRHVTPLQEAERAFIEAYRAYMNDAVDNETFNNLHDAMDDAWNHLQQTEANAIEDTK